ncbi:hypothetical protein J8273_2462 [Carpediemonas membranifera]|uniref:Uncharacterized protein n=1 Tax=Carpediemonas membranifera TaxID=201153 RepID=A0A8J6AZJ1_9EUKA|nr:hypothetical protein J8273_2462 [Carpediemonas membranifera]|eukprot:KAG9396110.1 hypothetical protein J8273_2462 [Carpediemonas membranifera]
MYCCRSNAKRVRTEEQAARNQRLMNSGLDQKLEKIRAAIDAIETANSKLLETGVMETPLQWKAQLRSLVVEKANIMIDQFLNETNEDAADYASKSTAVSKSTPKLYVPKAKIEKTERGCRFHAGATDHSTDRCAIVRSPNFPRNVSRPTLEKHITLCGNKNIAPMPEVVEELERRNEKRDTTRPGPTEARQERFAEVEEAFTAEEYGFTYDVDEWFE